MGGKIAASLAALTILFALNAMASPIAAAPCASSASIDRGTAAMRRFLQPIAGAQRAQGMVLLDCRVKRDQHLACTADRHTDSQYDLGAAALAFAGELEVCPGTPRRLMFPLVIRPDSAATPSPSP